METLTNALIPAFSQIFYVIACGVMLLIASITDIKSRKIYNWLTISMVGARIVAGIVYSFVYGFDGWFTLSCLAGGTILFLLFLIPTALLNGSAGGDIKLAGCIGLWTGLIPGIVITIVASALYIVFKVLVKNKKTKTNISFISIGYKTFSAKVRKSVPFAPFYMAGWAAMLILHICINGNIVL